MNTAINGIVKGSGEDALRARVGIFGLCTVVAGAMGYEPLHTLFAASRSDYYSHILLVPFITAFFLFEQRKEIVKRAEYKPVGGIILGGIGIIVYLSAFWIKALLGPNDFASMTVAGCILLWWGAFLLTFGREAFVVSRFGLLFICFMIPIPEFLLSQIIYALQVGSTEITQWLFELTGTNYIRDGFVYRLTGINIEVAKECSGIRSTLALVITGVVASKLFLKSGWRKVALLLALFPISVFKNGVRILTLSLLAVYVDVRFITGSFLHHSGGFLFYIPAILLMGLMVLHLRKGETRKEDRRHTMPDNQPPTPNPQY